MEGDNNKMIKLKSQASGISFKAKRILCLLLSVIMLVSVFSSFGLRSSANAAMSSITVQWANPQQLRKINKTAKEVF